MILVSLWADYGKKTILVIRNNCRIACQSKESRFDFSVSVNFVDNSLNNLSSQGMITRSDWYYSPLKTKGYIPSSCGYKNETIHWQFLENKNKNEATPNKKWFSLLFFIFFFFGFYSMQLINFAVTVFRKIFCIVWRKKKKNETKNVRKEKEERRQNKINKVCKRVTGFPSDQLQ